MGPKKKQSKIKTRVFSLETRLSARDAESKRYAERKLLSNAPGVVDEVLDYTFKCLLLAKKPIAPLKPVF